MILRLAFASKITEKYSSKGEENRMEPATVLCEKCGRSSKGIRLRECQRLMKTDRRGKRHKSSKNKISGRRTQLTFHKDF